MFWKKILGKSTFNKNDLNVRKNKDEFNVNKENQSYFTYLKQNPSWSLNINYSKLEEIYKSNSTIFRCIHLISECANSMQITCENQTIKSYLNNNFEDIITNLLLYGNCFLHRDLFILPIQNVSILFHPTTKEIIGYKDQFKTYSPHEILHLKYCSTPGSLFSIGPVQVSMKWVDICNYIQNYINVVMEHGGKPSGILTHGACVNDREKQLLKDQFKELYNQLNHKGQTLMIEGKVEWHPIGSDPDKLNLIEHWNNSVKEIANCFGVPIILLGVKDTATFSNYSNARKHLWEDLVIPFLLNILNKIEVFYNHSIKLNTQNIEILNEKIWQHNLLTINEKRQLLGYAPIEGGDKLGAFYDKKK